MISKEPLQAKSFANHILMVLKNVLHYDAPKYVTS